MQGNRKKHVNEFVQTKDVLIQIWEEYFKELYYVDDIINIEETASNMAIEDKEVTEDLRN